MVSIPSLLREACPSVSGADQVRTAGDLAAFSIRQEEALMNCDKRRAAVVELVDRAQEKPKWWRFHKPDS